MWPPSYHLNSVRHIFKSRHDPDSVETLSRLSRSPNSNLRAQAFGTEIPGYRAARCLFQYRFKSTTIVSPIHRRKACKYLRSEVEGEHWLGTEMLVGEPIFLSPSSGRIALNRAH